MQITSLIFGILSIVGMLVAFMPCLGSLNWINIPFAIIGLVISYLAKGKVEEGESQTKAMVGLILCGIAVVFGLIRLVLGGGVV